MLSYSEPFVHPTASWTIIISEARVIKLLPPKQRSDNQVNDDVLTLVRCLNKHYQLNRDPNRDDYVIEAPDYELIELTGLSKKRIQNAKRKLVDIGVLVFWKRTKRKNGSWRHLWNISIKHSRQVRVIRDKITHVIRAIQYIKDATKYKKFIFTEKEPEANFVPQEYEGVFFNEMREGLSATMKRKRAKEKLRAARKWQQRNTSEPDLTEYFDFGF